MKTQTYTQQRTSGRSRAALGLGAAFALACLVTVSQLIDSAQGSHHQFSEVWGALIVGVVELLLMASIGAGLRRASLGVRNAGTVTLAVLAWLSMIAWWVAAPAFLGVTAAWVGGLLDPDAPPPRGPGRTAGIIGLFAATANAILILGALLITVFGS